MNGRKLVAWNLRRIRVRQNLSQERLALDAQVDRSYVGRLERMLENPTVAILEKLARALRVHLSELFAEPKIGLKAPSPLRRGRKSSTVDAKPKTEQRA